MFAQSQEQCCSCFFWLTFVLNNDSMLVLGYPPSKHTSHAPLLAVYCSYTRGCCWKHSTDLNDGDGAIMPLDSGYKEAAGIQVNLGQCMRRLSLVGQRFSSQTVFMSVCIAQMVLICQSVLHSA